jgi:hypothetical protein
MAIDITATPFQAMITNFSKSVTRTPVTKSTSNFSGDETLTDGTPGAISAAFYRKEDEWMQDKIGLLQGADAIIMVLPSQTLNKDDKITYDSENYRVDKIITRRLATTSFYKVGTCFKI